jgi:single-stranded-DNA-specific exonuclease
MPSKTYTVRPEIPEGVRKELAGHHPILQKLLYSRGILTAGEAEAFLNPDYTTHLHDPYLFSGMERAVERVLRAIKDNEKIIIYSDYDADGIPGGVVLKQFFDQIGYKSVENYIPHRQEEGYGLHMEAVEAFKEKGINLIITVDCGIADTEQVARAQELGIDVIITDHHEPGAMASNAFAIINPKLTDSTYPERILCGSGVVYKLIQGILLKNRFGLTEGKEKWFLDLVGMATLSDMVPLVGENRALAYFGLKVLRKSPRPGLQAIWSTLGVDQRTVSEDDIGFSLAPRINAASRMGHPKDAFDLLNTEDLVEAGRLSAHLNSINDERKGVVASLVKEIKKHLRVREAEGDLPKVLVFGNPLWKPSLLGLVANSIVDDISRPVFLWGRNGDSVIKGSCRSDGATDLIALMEGAKDAFTQYGGHTMAGGFSLSNEQVHTLESALNKSWEALPAKDSFSQIFLDERLTVPEITWDIYRHIERLSPFGVGNSKPIFLVTGGTVSSVKQFGKERNHLEVVYGANNKMIKAISFFSAPSDFSAVPEVGKPINLIGSLEKSNYRNYPELRLRIIDIIES